MGLQTDYMNIDRKIRRRMLEIFLEDYDQIYVLDLVRDRIERIWAKRTDEAVDSLFSGTYSDFHRAYCHTIVDPSYNVWREKAGSIERIRNTLGTQDTVSISYPLADGTWRRIDGWVLEREGDQAVSVLFCVLSMERIEEQQKSDRYKGEQTDAYIQSLRSDIARGLRLSSAASADTVGTFEIDLTRDMVVNGDIRRQELFYHEPGVDIPGALPEHVASWAQRIQPPTRDQFSKLVQRDVLLAMYERGEREVSLDYKVFDRSGAGVYLRETLILSTDDLTGNVIATCVMRDVTGQKRTEEQNLKRMEVIEGLSREYDSVFFVELETEEYEIFRLSSRIRQLYGKCFVPGYQETLEEMAKWCVFSHDREYFLRLLSPGNIRRMLGEHRTYDFNFRCGPGASPVYYRGKVVRLGGMEGEPTRVLLGFANIQEERRVELQQRSLLENALRQARNADTAKSAFLSNMSHDIRTPMNAIVGFTEIALAHLDEPDKVRDSLRKIRTASSHLLQLVGDVLDISRIESGRLDLEERPCDLMEVLESVSDIIQPQAEQKGLQFTVDVERHMETHVYCDQLRVTQVLLNLLSNAVKYTPEGGQVQLSLRETEGAPQGYMGVEIRVRDNGIGMSVQFQEKLFEPFERERNTTVSRVMGSGLGMPICKSIVESMGGTIQVESRPGVGSTFTVVLALRLQEGQEKHHREERYNPLVRLFGKYKQRAPISPVRLKGCRILLVEDNDLNREIAAEMIEEEGLLVTHAGDGREAVDILMRSDPGEYAAVLMDIQMPVMDGYEATHWIRALQDPVNAEIPIIAMTANAFDEDVRHCREAGMDAYIGKPVEGAAVRYVLQRVLT